MGVACVPLCRHTLRRSRELACGRSTLPKGVAARTALYLRACMRVCMRACSNGTHLRVVASPKEDKLTYLLTYLPTCVWSPVPRRTNLEYSISASREGMARTCVYGMRACVHACNACNACMRACVHVCMCACMCACVHVCVHVWLRRLESSTSCKERARTAACAASKAPWTVCPEVSDR